MGGQALNLWAEYYSAAPELGLYRPYTSKDIDYFGQRAAAQKLADSLQGTVVIPNMDDATPQTALVRANVDGHHVEVDFLGNVLGVRASNLQRSVSELLVPCVIDGVETEIAIPLMHPLHCLQSRVANVVTLRRSDDTAKRQLEASPVVLREYLREALDAGDRKEVTRTFGELFAFLRRHTDGRQAHRHMKRDPLEIFEAFVDDERLHEKYRRLTLRPMIAMLRARRTRMGRFLDTFSKADGIDEQYDH